MAKSPDAFRTISEVADWLGIQAHVLRFWESKFTQVKPIKRAGGRRYYRPADMLLLGGIKKLLHDDGLTIKGVQKILREEGMSHVADMSEPLDELTMSQLDEAAPKTEEKPATAVASPKEAKGVVLNFEGGSASKSDQNDAQNTDLNNEKKTDHIEDISAKATPIPDSAPDVEPAAPESKPAQDLVGTPEVTNDEPSTSKTAPEQPKEIATSEPDLPHTPDPEPAASVPETAPPETAIKGDISEPAPVVQESTSEPAAAAEQEEEKPAPAAALPAFLRRPLVEPEASDPKTQAPDTAKPEDTPAVQTAQEPEPSPEPAPPAPKPRIIDLPAFTSEADFPASPAALSAAFRTRKIKEEHKAQASTLIKQLTALRDSMAARRRSATPPPAKD